MELSTRTVTLDLAETFVIARESQDTGRRVALRSTFPWPVVS